ncbi:hypothetical protein C1I95_28775 [Micromonospora craterilacus]|uniref:Uncharacterized protein n=1 Tax=Micromonospora craterilacus TaxID=1655439 RepID=A0A2W2EK60_9ACTN|nr:hypothetical protein C1I95_28775 [Micromonospora craterilacus]
MVNQPVERWTTADVSGLPRWWHVADSTPICPAPRGSFSDPIIVDETMPADTEASTWLTEMTDLFAIYGPGDPGRLASAVTAAEHLHHWLHSATGPASAPIALPTPADAAFLIGHVHRTSRLLARIQAQAGDYAVDHVRFAGFTDDTSTRESPESMAAANDLRALLHHAAEMSAAAAQYSGSAWSHARTAAGTAGGAATEPSRADADPPAGTSGDGTRRGKRRHLDELKRWFAARLHRNNGDVPRPDSVTDTPSPAQLAEQIGVAFDDEATFGPEQTRAAARAIATLAGYVATCLSVARPAAITSATDLADLTTTLTYLTHTLGDGLQHVVDSPPGRESDGLASSDARFMRTALTEAALALHVATRHLASTANIADGPTPEQEPPW